MSLIQQALDKTNRAQQTRTMNPIVAPKPWDRDPTGVSLEQQLVQVQGKYARQQRIYREFTIGVVLLCVLFVLGYVGIWKGRSTTPQARPVTPAARAVPQAMPLIYSGYIYRLTGITNIGDKAIAVINNRLVGVGDLVNGKAAVKSIGDGEVRLDIQGKEILLTL